MTIVKNNNVNNLNDESAAKSNTVNFYYLNSDFYNIDEVSKAVDMQCIKNYQIFEHKFIENYDSVFLALKNMKKIGANSNIAGSKYLGKAFFYDLDKIFVNDYKGDVSWNIIYVSGEK